MQKRSILRFGYEHRLPSMKTANFPAKQQLCESASQAPVQSALPCPSEKVSTGFQKRYFHYHQL